VEWVLWGRGATEGTAISRAGQSRDRKGALPARLPGPSVLCDGRSLTVAALITACGSDHCLWL